MIALVFGSRGLLGRALCRALRVPAERLFAPPSGECDIAREDQVARMIRQTKPTVVFNAAAYNAVDRAEREPDVAHRINAVAPGVLARTCHAEGAMLVHYSTDFVFDGSAGRPYTEDDEPRPLSAYGRSKLAGERAVFDQSSRAAVIRTAWLFGEGGRSFGSTLVARLAAGTTFRVDATRVGSPTWADSLAAQSIAIAERGHSGLFHAVCRGAASWFDVARFMAVELGVNHDCIEAAESEALGLAAARPRFSVLENERLAALEIDCMPTWQDAVRRYLERRRLTMVPR